MEVKPEENKKTKNKLFDDDDDEEEDDNYKLPSHMIMSRNIGANTP